jgi:5-methylcytosine-specific restriction protein B
MNVRSLENLDRAMRRKVIPLLQEYFYEDWSKIRLALNDHVGLFIEESRATLTASSLADDLHEPKSRFAVREQQFPVQAYLNIYS